MLFIFIIIAVFLTAIVVAVIFLRKAGGGSFPWVQFYLKGKESGFAFKEVNLLRRVSVDHKMKDPTSLFWSIKLLDRCIKGTVLKFRSKEEEETVNATSLISKLYEFRKRVELNQPKYKLGLKSSREIQKHQRMKLNLPDKGPFSTVVVENLKRYMAVSYPEGPNLPPDFPWKGQQIGINFWRKGDAGYFFQSKVINDFSAEKSYPILHVSQNDNITRTQQRRSIRVPVNVIAQLYPLKTKDNASEEFENRKGLKIILVDISEDGAALVIGGKAKVGLPIKIQFKLSDRDLAMCGVIREINYDEKKNRSLLHIQAFPLSAKMRNAILSFVYDILGEQTALNKTSKKIGQK